MRFIAAVQRGGRGQLMDILLIGWWRSNWESVSSTFWFQQVCGLRAYGHHTVNFFHLVGASVSAEQLKDTVNVCPSRRNRDPAPSWGFFTAPPSSLHPLPL